MRGSQRSILGFIWNDRRLGWTLHIARMHGLRQNVFNWKRGWMMRKKVMIRRGIDNEALLDLIIQKFVNRSLLCFGISLSKSS
jgi:hypothetical protein